MTVYGVSSSTTTVLLRTTQCPVASSRTVLVLSVSAAVVGFYAPVVFRGPALRHLDGEPARFSRSVTVALRLGRTGSFPLFFFPRIRDATAAAERKSARQSGRTCSPVTFVYFVPRRRLDQRHSTGRGPLVVGSGPSSAVAASRSGTGTGATWWHCLIQNLVWWRL